jgi:hypothetical protein
MTAPSTLLDKVRRFLPQMEKANAVLEEARVAGTLGARSMEVDEGEEGGGDGGGGMYIEMVSLDATPAVKEGSVWTDGADVGIGSWIGRVGTAGWDRWGE